MIREEGILVPSPPKSTKPKGVRLDFPNKVTHSPPKRIGQTDVNNTIPDEKTTYLSLHKSSPKGIETDEKVSNVKSTPQDDTARFDESLMYTLVDQYEQNPDRQQCKV